MSNARNLANLLGTRTQITTADIADGAFQANKNLIINGAMQMAQRGTSSSSSGYQTVDRFKTNLSGPTITQSQHSLTSSDTPYSYGFRSSYHIEVTGVGTNAATDYLEINQNIEAQNIAKSGWNYTSASSFITLSFWVKASVAGTYAVLFDSTDGTQQLYGFEYTVSANTWKKVTHTIPGYSNIAVDNDNGIGLRLFIILYYGTDYTVASSPLNEQWGTLGSPTDYVNDFAQNMLTTANATFEVTGVQLEVGETATPFEHRSYGDELARCQRYYAKTYNDGVAPGTATSAGSVFHSLDAQQGYAKATWDFPVTMRSNPTIVLYNDNDGTSGQVSGDSTNYTGSAAYIGNNRAIGGVSGIALGGSTYLRFHATMDAEL